MRRTGPNLPNRTASRRPQLPELPEVETVRRDLQHEAAGKTITHVRVDGVRTVRRHDPALLVGGLPGRRIERVERLGKFLIIRLDHGSCVVHLRMSGQLLWTPDPVGTELRRHTHARLTFDTGEELRFVDPRTFGELWLTGDDLPELSHIGPDAYDEVLDVATLRHRMIDRRRGLKVLLLDQTVIAGIGNLYADEILWLAKLRYDRTPDTLSPAAWRRLFEANREVLTQAIELRGSSLADQQYLDLYGRAGHDQHEHRVYAREGEPCLRCGGIVQRTKVGGRSAFWCPNCQH